MEPTPAAEDHRISPSELAELLRRDRQMHPGDEPIVIDDYDGPAMSELLNQFIEPLRDQLHTIGDLRWAVAVGSIAWSVATMPAGERRETLRDLYANMPADARRELKPLVRQLVRRKLAHFAEHERYIVDAIVTEHRGVFRIAVNSTFPSWDTPSK